MKNIITILLLCCICISSTLAQKRKPTSLFFKGGEIVAAEIMDKSPNIKNISKFEPPSKMTKNVGWAVVVLKPDKGRTLGIYDYVLKNNKKKAFPCVALREVDNAFDADQWRIEKTDPKKLYSMVFKVEKPGLGKLEFNLHYNLPLGKTKDIILKFQEVHEFTSPKSIPPEGIYAIAPLKSTKPPAKKQTEKQAPAKTKTKKISFSKSNYKTSSEGGPTNTIDKAFDGKTETEWHTFSKNERDWIRINIPGGKKTIAKMVIKWGNSYPKNLRVVTKEQDKKNVTFGQVYKTSTNKGGETSININADIEVIKIVDMDKPSSKVGAKAIFKIKEIEVYEK